jgi:hypothetical protein
MLHYIFYVEFLVQLVCCALLLSHWVPSLFWRIYLAKTSGSPSWLWAPSYLVQTETTRLHGNSTSFHEGALRPKRGRIRRASLLEKSS